MPTAQNTEALLQTIREQRSNEGHFETLAQILQAAIITAEENQDTALANDLKEVDEKYAREYEKAKEAGGTAWPEFEKFVSQFERALTAAQKD